MDLCVSTEELAECFSGITCGDGAHKKMPAAGASEKGRLLLPVVF